ncbi:hypothetical protein K439DRAFT_376925 [Ramaria rubella]|nr:hypothetical protein K439DRAFT_376925 [Ramaria rubella]
MNKCCSCWVSHFAVWARAGFSRHGDRKDRREEMSMIVDHAVLMRCSHSLATSLTSSFPGAKLPRRSSTGRTVVPCIPTIYSSLFLRLSYNSSTYRSISYEVIAAIADSDIMCCVVWCGGIQ